MHFARHTIISQLADMCLCRKLGVASKDRCYQGRFFAGFAHADMSGRFQLISKSD